VRFEGGCPFFVASIARTLYSTSELNHMKEKLSLLKEFFGMVREALIIFLFLFLFCFPTAFKSQLARVGFDKFDMGGLSMEIKSQMKETAQTGDQVAELQQQIGSLKTIIDSLASKSTNSEEKKTLSGLAERTQSIYSSTDLLDTKVKQQLSLQQRDAVKLKINIADEGWIYVGKLNETKTEWDNSIPSTIAEHKLDFQSGDIVTIIDDVYLRSDGASTSHANSQVIGVIKASEKVIYLSKDFSHAVNGGWFLWLRVRRIPSGDAVG
jgi:hypothetical protein